jgi:biofilm PGA synthesis lipoprotein PgaB
MDDTAAPVPETDASPADTPEAIESPTESASQKLPVLMYHHVVPDGSSCNDMTVTVSKLAKDFQWLKDHGYEAILPQQLISGEALPEKPILITFDDGYRSNYDLAFPLFREYGMKAVISIMVYMQDHSISSFMSWEMCREMADSGLVEIGSHTYRLHNLDDRNGNFTPGGVNGIQRDPNESDEEFQARVLGDLQLSHDLIEANLGCDLTFFAYPFGIREPDAEALIQELFPVTVVTAKGTADLSAGTKYLTRWTVTINTDLASILPS